MKQGSAGYWELKKKQNEFRAVVSEVLSFVGSPVCYKVHIYIYIIDIKINFLEFGFNYFV